MDVKKFKRILIINDDDTEEQFYKKYDTLQMHQDMISYCNNPTQAFEYLISENFYGFDKIILDIKIEWEVPEKYIPKLNEHVDVKVLTNANKGFLMFMYLVARGYPINRIAFLSAYIKERDDELEEKTRILEEITTWKKRDEEQDSRLIQNLNKIPSLKGKIIRILKNNSYNKGIKAYTEIKKILLQDTLSFQDFHAKISEEEESTETFFDLLSQTGLIVKNKINKKDKDKLKAWIENEKTEELRNYYRFRNRVLNICEFVMNQRPHIYNSIKSLEKKYPQTYFEELIKKLQYQISAFKEDEDIEQIAENTVSSLVAFWEDTSKGAIAYTDSSLSMEDINHHALTMLLKSTRNWHAHGRLKTIGITFCEFIFLSSVRIIYGNIETLTDYIEKDLNLNGVHLKDANSTYYKKIWKNVNKKIIDTKKNDVNTYIISIDYLYSKYAGELRQTEIQLTICDLYEMFLLFLHFSNVVTSDTENESFQIAFHEIDYTKQERYMSFLERFAMDQLEQQ